MRSKLYEVLQFRSSPVTRNNRVHALSAGLLTKIFYGERDRWPDGQRIQIPATNPDAPEHEAAIRFLFGFGMKMRKSVESAVRKGRSGYAESGRLPRFHEEGLHGCTYPKDPGFRTYRERRPKPLRPAA